MELELGGGVRKREGNKAMQDKLKTQDKSTHSPMYHTRTGTTTLQGKPSTQKRGYKTLLLGRQYKTHSIPKTRQVTFKKQGTHRQGKYKAMQSKLTTQSKREQKVTKWNVQIVENGVGRAGFGELPVTLCKGDQVRTKGVVLRNREER